MTTGFTLDAGSLIAWERRHARAMRLLDRACEHRIALTVPAVVIAEWWRGRSGWRERMQRSFEVEPMDEALARAAGEALAAVRGATTIDAIVVASAARRGDVILTSDVGDLSRLAAHFGGVRVLAV